jgi:(2Fe-2S) ferredoxin
MTRHYHIRVCRGPECGDRRGSPAVYGALRDAIRGRGLVDRCELTWHSCFGRCTQGPNVLVREIVSPGPSPVPAAATALYTGVDVVSVEEVVAQHLERGVTVGRLIRQAPDVLRLSRRDRA